MESSSALRGARADRGALDVEGQGLAQARRRAASIRAGRRCGGGASRRARCAGVRRRWRRCARPRRRSPSSRRTLASSPTTEVSLAGADVVDARPPVRRGWRAGRGPGRRRRRSRGSACRRRRCAGVSPAEEFLRQDRDDSGLALGVLPRAVDVGVAQDHRLEIADPAEGFEVLLEGELGAAVGRIRRGRVGLVAGKDLLRAVHRAARGGEQHPAHARRAAGLEESQAADAR